MIAFCPPAALRPTGPAGEGTVLVTGTRDVSETRNDRKIHSFEVTIQKTWPSAARDAFKKRKRQFGQMKYCGALGTSRVFGERPISGAPPTPIAGKISARGRSPSRSIVRRPT